MALFSGDMWLRKIKTGKVYLVEIRYYDVLKKVANPKLHNFALLVWKMNLVKNQEFMGQLGENQPFVTMVPFAFYLSWENIKKYWYMINFFMNL